MSLKDFKNPWGEKGKYWKDNALQNNVIDLENFYMDVSSSSNLCNTGRIELINFTNEQLNEIRIIPEKGIELITPDANKSYFGDGFYWKYSPIPNKYWYKVSAGSAVEVKRVQSTLLTTPLISKTCKYIAETMNKYYKVGWEPKSKKHTTDNPFE